MNKKCSKFVLQAMKPADSAAARKSIHVIAGFGGLCRQIDAGQQPIPGFKMQCRLRPLSVNVATAPHFRRCAAI